MAKRKLPSEQDDGLLPQNMSFLGKSRRPLRVAGSTRRRSWVARIALTYIRSAVVMTLLSLVPSLVLLAVLWWAMPAWLVAPVKGLLNLHEVVDTNAITEWTQQATDNLRDFAEPATPPDQAIRVD